MAKVAKGEESQKNVFCGEVIFEWAVQTDQQKTSASSGDYINKQKTWKYMKNMGKYLDEVLLHNSLINDQFRFLYLFFITINTYPNV